MSDQKSGRLSQKWKVIIALAAIVLLALGITLFNYYMKFFGPSVTNNAEYLYIRTGSTFDDVYKSIESQEMVKNPEVFKWAAEKMGYPAVVKPGKYKLKTGMSNRNFINMLKAGNQEPVNLRFKSYRIKEDFAKYVSSQLEADSVSLVRLLDSSEYISKYGFNKDNVFAVFIPNSYEMYWNTSADKFFNRMYEEYQKFWSPARKDKAKAIGLTELQVSSLAAVVDAEALYDNEMPTIAGLYMNRYKKGIKLQADPTVIYANKDFTIRRVLNKHLLKDSPFNTYIYTGLPPGPIMMPSINAIDAVLNHKKHNFIYMCAKEDFSGYHNFAVTQAEHLANARRFQQALNERNIKK